MTSGRGWRSGAALAVTLVLLGVLGATPAQAIVITSGPTYSPGGGWGCASPAPGSEKLAGGATYTCSGTAGTFSNLYIGIKNNNVPSGTVPIGEKMDSNGTTEPTGAAIFSWSSETATTIVYTGSTTIATFGTVFLRTTLTFTGAGSVVDDATTIGLSNANGAVHSLWRIAPAASSMTVNALIEASTSASGPWTPARTFFGTTTTHRQGTGSAEVDKSHVDLGFYASSCGDATVDTNFGAEQCDTGIAGSVCCTSACQFAAPSTVCRGSAGICDVAENCTGSSATCPANGFVPNTTVCRASAGVCDVAENCSGSGAACPADSFVSSATVCRASADVCDVAENCTGSSANCPADSFEPSSTVCRTSAGVCDVAENCTGSSVSCPTDSFEPSSTVCRTSADVCDVAENCTGSSANCPADSFQPSSTVCRTSAGACDVAENCTGAGASCPTDAKSTAVCRPAVGVCDLDDVCDGAGDTCPPDSVLGAFVECRAAAGVCDLAESCDGTSGQCPADTFVASSTVCRASAGVCDVAENCTGTSAQCPANAFQPSTVVCRAAADACDIVESCTGSSSSCPADQVAPDSDGDSTCDLVDNCQSVPNPGQADGDGDDIGDQCDPCTNAQSIQTTRTKLIISKLSTPPGDDKLKYKGEIIVPTTPAIDLIAKGARVIITDSVGTTVLDATIPGGLYNPAQKAGWKSNATATSFKYSNSGSVIPLVGGIYKASIKKVLSTPGRLKFGVSGKLGSYGVAPNHLPLQATLVVEGPIGIDNQCGDSLFPGPRPTPSCSLTGGGSGVRCN